MKVSNVDFEDFNGVPGKSVFSPSKNITKRLSAEFSQPIIFEFSKGQITDIRTAPGVSNTVVNIVRGILGFLQVTIKTTQSFYELVEVQNLNTGSLEMCVQGYVFVKLRKHASAYICL